MSIPQQKGNFYSSRVVVALCFYFQEMSLSNSTQINVQRPRHVEQVENFIEHQTSNAGRSQALL
jgi:hypothetical protein